MTDKDLYTLLRQGDRKAYTLIFHTYKEILLRHAYRILRDWDDAEDSVQEVFFAIWEKRSNLPPDAVLSSYLYRSVRNSVLNRLSRDKVIDRYLEHVFNTQDHFESTTEEHVLERELKTIIEQEIANLPPRMREVFTLSRHQGLSHKQIAELLGISEGTAKLQVSKALQVLRKKILLILPLLSGI